MNQEAINETAKGLLAKIKAAYAYNPFTIKRDTPITCPKCHTENLAIAVSCKECGEQFAYKPMKRGVILGVGLSASIFLLIASWIAWACGSGVMAFLWYVSIAGIVGAVASYKMKHWGWKVESFVVVAWECLFLSGNEGIFVAIFGGALILSPLIAASWLGYKSMKEAGEYLDNLHHPKKENEGSSKGNNN